MVLATNCQHRLAALDGVACHFSNKFFVRCIEAAHEFNTTLASDVYIELAVIWSAPSDVQYVTVKLTRCRPQPLDANAFSKKVIHP